MFWLFMLQLIIPPVLVGIICVLPARTWPGLVSGWCALLLGLGALALDGLWLFPPWWYPWFWLGTGVLLYGLRSDPRGNSEGSRVQGSLAIALHCLIGIAAAWPLLEAWQGRKVPGGQVLDLAFPLETGRYLVVNGGSTLAVNAHLRTLDAAVPAYQRWRGQSRGVDIVAIDIFGLRSGGLQPVSPAAYRIHAATVLAPCNGVVLEAVDGLPDLPVPEVDRDSMAGNHVRIGCQDFHVVLAHLLAGSLQVRAGDAVTVGEPLGLVGNTGNSNEPHLHIHAQTPGTSEQPFSGTPIPVRLDGRYLVRNQRVSVR